MFNRATKTALFILLLAFQSFGQQAGPSGCKAPLKPIPSMKTTVGFIRVNCKSNGATWDSTGTGFFVTVGDKLPPERQGFTYLVTNRHVAQPKKEGKVVNILNTYLRLNQCSPDAREESVEFPLGPGLRWYFPADEADDLAVLPFTPDPRKVIYSVVPLSLFATKDVIASQEIAEGDKVVFTGFFYQFSGIQRMEPVVREGIVAMMPSEKIVTTLGKPGNLYLADVHIFGGNSGSPVFVNTGGTRGSNVTGDHFWLLGIVSGGVHEDADFKLTVATTVQGKLQANSGICAVVPVDKLKAVLEQPELQKLRDDVIERPSPKK